MVWQTSLSLEIGLLVKNCKVRQCTLHWKFEKLAIYCMDCTIYIRGRYKNYSYPVSNNWVNSVNGSLPEPIFFRHINTGRGCFPSYNCKKSINNKGKAFQNLMGQKSWDFFSRYTYWFNWNLHLKSIKAWNTTAQMSPFYFY